ncbi:hypothetical protein CLOM_g5237 [Closterium sp. NIES-68]|nr:hypothetical protein CLOM_g5237 [Closterium sp. NIES-68]GJP58804.1 hypothetical protein CLOP_g3602 [Closterium sp. NIES-67]
MGIGGGFKNTKKRPAKGSVAAFPTYGDSDATLVLHGPMSSFNTLAKVALYNETSKKLDYVTRPFRTHVYYVPLTVGSRQQRFLAQVDLLFSALWVPCDCIKCGKGRPQVPRNPPFSTLSSYSLQYLSCSDPRCVSVGLLGLEPPLVGCNDPDKVNPYVNTSLIPGNDPLCVYTTPLGDAGPDPSYDFFDLDNTTILYANASDPAIGPLNSVGHVVADTLFFPGDPATAAAVSAVDAAADAAAAAGAGGAGGSAAAAAAAAPPPVPPLSNRTIFFGCGATQSGWWGQDSTWAPNGVVGLGPFSPLLNQLANETLSFAMCLEKPRERVENLTRWNETEGKWVVVPQVKFDGGSHLMVGPVDFPANASSTTIFPIDDFYFPVTYSNSNYTMGGKLLQNQWFKVTEHDFNVVVFSSTLFTHFLRPDLVKDILAALGYAKAFADINTDNTTLACFQSKKDPFTTFPSIHIGFAEGSEFAIPASGYVTKVGTDEYCFLFKLFDYFDIWAAPALYDKQIYINYRNFTLAWIDTPQCSKNLSFVPPLPSPPPPAPTSSNPGVRLVPLSSISWRLLLSAMTAALLLHLLLHA